MNGNKITFVVNDLCCDDCMKGCLEILKKIQCINNVIFYYHESTEKYNDINVYYDLSKITVDDIKKAIESYGNGQINFYEIIDVKE